MAALSEVGAWILGRRLRRRISGESMLPTLEEGDFVLVDPGRSAGPGDLVLALHPGRDLSIVKRIGVDGPAIWLTSDNAAKGTDSRSFGPVGTKNIVGVVTLVLNRPLSSLASPECSQ